jgi:predicted ATPase
VLGYLWLLARLRSPLKILIGGARDQPARQQTIRNTIDWSYQLLNESDQTLLAQLGVFVGGCMLEAAEVVCIVNGDLQLDVVDGIASLLDKSLIYQIENTDGEPRCTLLETMPQHVLAWSRARRSSGRAGIGVTWPTR